MLSFNCVSITMHEGKFRRNARWGYGTEFNGTFVIYAGQWKYGKRHGNGTEYKNNAVYYEGQLK